MGRQEHRCPVCGSKKVRILRYVYACRSCRNIWDKKTGRIIRKEIDTFRY